MYESVLVKEVYARHRLNEKVESGFLCKAALFLGEYKEIAPRYVLHEEAMGGGGSGGGGRRRGEEEDQGLSHAKLDRRADSV